MRILYVDVLKVSCICSCSEYPSLLSSHESVLCIMVSFFTCDCFSPSGIKFVQGGALSAQFLSSGIHWLGNGFVMLFVMLLVFHIEWYSKDVHSWDVLGS